MFIQLAIIGLLVALVPLTFVWVSHDTHKYRQLVLAILFLSFDLILFGAFTRLTDSGLGCPDWPGCYGHSNPLAAHAQINAAQQAMPTGPVTWTKAWIEMIHRYLAMAIGVLIIALAAIAWRHWVQSYRRDSRFHPGLPTFLLLFVCLQGAFGAWTVTMLLQPLIVMMHLLLGVILLALLAWLSAQQIEHKPIPAKCYALRTPAMLAILLLMLQIALGGWVSANYAALACHDFPLCQGALMPPMDFKNGFTVWRHFTDLELPALTAIHWAHRWFALIVMVYIVWLACRIKRYSELRKLGNRLLLIVILQFLTGVLIIHLRWPLTIAVIHNGGAALILLLLVRLSYKLQYAPSIEDVLRSNKTDWLSVSA